MNRHTLPARTLAGLFPKLYPGDKNLPKRILFVSAHFESKRSDGFEISSSANPKMFYDYSGFPAESYKVNYPAKGDPAFAQKVKEKLESNNIKAKLVDRGFDHGVFVPMLLIRPQADIPIVSMSINSHLDDKTHFNLGKAIAPLRDEDLNHPIVDWAAAFQDWIDDTFTSKSALTYEQRTKQNLPKRILFVSAHFESDSSGFEISNAASPDMIYDYYGFPDEAYQVNYPAKGDPAFAQRVKEQLEKNNIKAKLVNRGYDHGVFVPMKLIRPQADIPIVTMSINSRLSNSAHFELGKAIAPFRDEDTLILCSGQSTHNLRGIHSRSLSLVEGTRAFQYWLDNSLASDSKLNVEERKMLITNWRDAPGARFAHPSPDHFMTFVVAAGAGMEDKEPGAKPFFGGWAMRHMSFANYAWGIQQ
ncbi:Hypothetical protein PHPALM_3191 [Phytophthora palmivora]|uniref:Extradiol ring-cleavage dioxygenase class III enzyme subunit B domain-containing protein n=1 Tax=Phytophthora palmivora TaxID=4796 RepID=A0A2P4YN09_9STRA|nr:Hypothetical protein PHPALM_3191 [Phytophthora palmivora]